MLRPSTAAVTRFEARSLLHASCHCVHQVTCPSGVRREQNLSRPHLVVVPLSTLPNWEREFATWAPQLNVVMLYGNQAAREFSRADRPS